MQEVEPREGPGLVALKVADEMPADRGLDGVHFGKRLLDSIFADVVKPGIDRGFADPSI